MPINCKLEMSLYTLSLTSEKTDNKSLEKNKKDQNLNNFLQNQCVKQIIITLHM